MLWFDGLKPSNASTCAIFGIPNAKMMITSLMRSGSTRRRERCRIILLWMRMVVGLYVMNCAF